MLQVDWQQEAARARSLLVAAHKGAMPLDALLQRPSVNLDLEAPRGSAASLEPVPEQASIPGTTAPMCFMVCVEISRLWKMREVLIGTLCVLACSGICGSWGHHGNCLQCIVAAVTVLDQAGISMSCTNHHDKPSTVNASCEAVTQRLTLRCAYRRSEQNLA